MRSGGIWARFERIDWLRPSVIALVLSNLVPIAGVFLFHWDVFPLLFLFWLENIVIGVINVLKILLAGSPNGWAEKLFTAVFFSVHYGMFTFVHGIFLVAIFGGGIHHGFLNLAMMSQIIRDNHLQWPLAALVISHLVSFGYDYLWRGEFRQTSVATLMKQPYSRVIIMHLTIIFGGFVMMVLKSPALGLAFLVCLKIIFDLHGQQKEWEKLPRGPANPV